MGLEIMTGRTIFDRDHPCRPGEIRRLIDLPEPFEGRFVSLERKIRRSDLEPMDWAAQRGSFPQWDVTDILTGQQIDGIPETYIGYRTYNPLEVIAGMADG